MEVETQRVLIAVFLPPLITAGLAAISISASEWRKDRDASQRIRNTILQENDHIAYLKSWFEVELLVGGTDGASVNAGEEVREQLAKSRARLARAELVPVQEARPSVIIRVAKTVALVPLSRPAARIVRLGYWFIFAFGLVLGLLVLAGLMDNSSDPVNGLSPGIIFFFSVILTMPFLAVAVLFAYWARALELRQRRNVSTASIGVPYPVVPSRPTSVPGDAYPVLYTQPPVTDYGGSNAPPWTKE